MDKVICKSEFFEVIKRRIRAVVQGKEVDFTTELARRAPGVRILVCDGDKYLIAKEYRYELNEWDYRLPGGRVFDTLNQFREAENMLRPIEAFCQDAVVEELKEEVGIIAKDMTLYKKSNVGARIEWDLYYYVVTKFELLASGAELEDGEFITSEWVSKDDLLNLCVNGYISEDRTVGVLMRYLLDVK